MKFIENKEAVSPVVGVMLMLVVTLIIAGVVSAFGGGLVSTTSATPQASISSSLTFGDSLKLSHNGGETIQGEALEVKTKLVSGQNIDMVSNVNLTEAKLPSGNGGKFRWYDGARYTYVYETLKTGDVLTVPWDNVFKTTLLNGEFVGYEPAKGDLVQITVIDKNSGKQIASSTIPVN
ncbi:MAG: type IV pilin N-terminal domain-containing protein [Methanomicrobium sp.]|nr:type IV pilin N-terminal domain-containing protein [Methanomicrobium sp.]